jgi:hypothetical protein
MEITIFRNLQDVDFIKGLYHGPGGERLYFFNNFNRSIRLQSLCGG